MSLISYFFYAFIGYSFTMILFQTAWTALIGLLLVAVVYQLYPALAGWMKEINTVTEAATVYSTILPGGDCKCQLKTTAAAPDGWLLWSAFGIPWRGVAVPGIRFAIYNWEASWYCLCNVRQPIINGVYVHLLEPSRTILFLSSDFYSPAFSYGAGGGWDTYARNDTCKGNGIHWT